MRVGHLLPGLGCALSLFSASPLVRADLPLPGWRTNGPAPSAPGDGFVWTSSGLPDEFGRGLGLSGEYVHRPVKALRLDKEVSAPTAVDAQTWMHVGVAWNGIIAGTPRKGPHSVFLAALDVPMLVHQAGDARFIGRSNPAFGDVGDIKSSIRWSVSQPFVVSLDLWLPTGVARNFGGDYGFRIEPRAGVDHAFNFFRLNGAVGFSWATSKSPALGGSTPRETWQVLASAAVRVGRAGWPVHPTIEADTRGQRPGGGAGVVATLTKHWLVKGGLWVSPFAYEKAGPVVFVGLLSFSATMDAEQVLRRAVSH